MHLPLWTMPMTRHGGLEAAHPACPINKICNLHLLNTSFYSRLLHTSKINYIGQSHTSMPGSQDVEKHAGQEDSQSKPVGFAAVSSLMASDGDQELLIFRKFDQLSARNLLYLQCELLLIEERLKKWDKKVSMSGDMDLEEAAETWEVLVEQAEHGNAEAKEMIDLVGQLRAKMKEYRE